MRIAIVHHWFVTQGGGERVAEVMASMFPDADLFTLVMDPDQLPEGVGGRSLTCSFLQRIPGGPRMHRHLLPLYPLAVEQLDLTSYDLVLTSDSGPMKGVITRPGAVHICYCHSPMRYLWDNYHAYQAAMPRIARFPFALTAHYLRNWDYVAAQRVTHFIANSHHVATRILHYYGRQSTVIHPPIDTNLGKLTAMRDNYYLAAGRLVAYKRTDLLIGACNRIGRRLRIVGAGPEMKHLRSLAGPTIEFVGSLNREQLWETYARCRALLFAADEDFGMVPLEAQACGRPVIAFGKGGSLETVRASCVDGRSSSQATLPATGIFFPDQSTDSVIQAIHSFEEKEATFEPAAIQVFARQFDTRLFIQQMGDFIQQHLAPT